MKINKKALAILAGLTVGMSSTAFAATADSFTDVPKDHWSYQALDYLAKEGIIDGMGDNTFQGGRTMTRYEMASIVAKAMQKGGGTFGDQAVLDKLAAEYSGEIDTLKKQSTRIRRISMTSRTALLARWSSMALSASSMTTINTIIQYRTAAT